MVCVAMNFHGNLSMLTKQQIAKLVACDQSQICDIFLCGSRVYGCAKQDSDEDFVVVIEKLDARQDLIFRDDVNIIVHTTESFQDALKNHNMLALECFFADDQYHLCHGKMSYKFKLDSKKLLQQVNEKSVSDVTKASKIFDKTPDLAKKKLYHSIRVLLFARQILQRGKIYDYGEANDLWEEIETRPGDWTAYADLIILRDRLNSEIQ